MTAERKPVRVTWWDRFLIAVAPRWGLSRLRARAAATAYEAASGGRRSVGWHRSSSDANAANATALVSLRELSRDLHRNNGWARRGIATIVNNTTGWGISPKAAAGTPPTKAKRALKIWNEWAQSPSCDFDGRMAFEGLQSLVMKTVVLSGECIIVRRRAAAVDGLPIPLRLQVLEPDYLDTTRDGFAGEGGGPVIQGIEIDNGGRRVAYYLYDHHPGSSRLVNASTTSRRVPAADVLHVYLVDRPGQARGVPWLCAAIAKLNDFDDFEDATLMQQKVAACFAAFVSDIEGAARPLGEQSDADELLETLEPGQIQYLPPGKDVKFATPPTVTDQSFTTRNLRRVAVSLGVTYEDLTGDYSQVNFSSARMGRIAHWNNVRDWRWNMFIPQFCHGVWRWAMEFIAAELEWPAAPRADWTAPPMQMLEPEKEGLAYQRLMRTGVMTLSEVIQERGNEPLAHLDEIRQMNLALDERGIILDSDPRRVNAQGGVQQVAGQGGGAQQASEDGEEEGDEGEEQAANGRLLS